MDNLYSHGRENTCDTATPLHGSIGRGSTNIAFRNLDVLLARGHCCSWPTINTGLFREEVASKHSMRRARRKEGVNTKFIGSSITDIRLLIFL